MWSRRFTHTAVADESPLALYRVLLAIECALIFIGIPTALLMTNVPFIVPLSLATSAAIAYARLNRVALHGRAPRADVLRVITRFAIAAVALLALPQLALRLPPIALIAFYPIVSVWPQEVLYRSFFFERYESLFGRSIVVASTVAFAFLHVIYRNPIAMILTLIGGFWFSTTYQRTRSLPLVWLEHSLYGLLMFSIGLGKYFYSGRFW